jgi:hypothetical protein
MPAILTEEEFSKHPGTKFRTRLDAQEIELDLSSVKGYAAGSNEQGGMERFSAFFSGPREPFLPQGIYQMSHESMGEFELFLVPIASRDQGFSYEAVFNYFKER